MNAKTKTGFDILKVALSLGILGDLLLRQTPWGLNVLLFNLAFVGVFVLLLWSRKPEYLTKQTVALMAAQVSFAAMFVWRDSIELRTADSFAILAILSVLLVPKMRVPARVAGAFHYVIGFFWSSLNAWLGAIPLLTMDIEWKDGNRSAWARHAIAVFRGLLIVAPIFFVFFALFMAADTNYQGIVQRVFDIAPRRSFFARSSYSSVCMVFCRIPSRHHAWERAKIHRRGDVRRNQIGRCWRQQSRAGQTRVRRVSGYAARQSLDTGAHKHFRSAG